MMNKVDDFPHECSGYKAPTESAPMLHITGKLPSCLKQVIWIAKWWEGSAGNRSIRNVVLQKAVNDIHTS